MASKDAQEAGIVDQAKRTLASSFLQGSREEWEPSTKRCEPSCRSCSGRWRAVMNSNRASTTPARRCLERAAARPDNAVEGKWWAVMDSNQRPEYASLVAGLTVKDGGP